MTTPKTFLEELEQVVGPSDPIEPADPVEKHTALLEAKVEALREGKSHLYNVLQPSPEALACDAMGDLIKLVELSSLPCQAKLMVVAFLDEQDEQRCMEVFGLLPRGRGAKQKTMNKVAALNVYLLARYAGASRSEALDAAYRAYDPTWAMNYERDSKDMGYRDPRSTDLLSSVELRIRRHIVPLVEQAEALFKREPLSPGGRARATPD